MTRIYYLSNVRKSLAHYFTNVEYVGFCSKYMGLCSIWYHLYTLKNVENIHGKKLLLVKVKVKVTLLHECFSRFLIWSNGTKLHKASHMCFSTKKLIFHKIATIQKQFPRSVLQKRLLPLKGTLMQIWKFHYMLGST